MAKMVELVDYDEPEKSEDDKSFTQYQKDTIIQYNTILEKSNYNSLIKNREPHFDRVEL